MPANSRWDLIQRLKVKIVKSPGNGRLNSLSDPVLNVLRTVNFTDTAHLLLAYDSDNLVPVTTAWQVLRLQMEERPPIWTVAANILISTSGQPTMGGPRAWGLGEVLTTPHRKNASS